MCVCGSEGGGRVGARRVVCENFVFILLLYKTVGNAEHEKEKRERERERERN